jgi:putative transposase
VYDIPHALRNHRHRFEIEGQARFLTCSCCKRAPVFHDQRLCAMFANHLASVQTALEFKLFAWVLMPEHFHLLLLPRLPDAPVPRILHLLKGPFARSVLERVKRGQFHVKVHPIWQPGGGYDRNIYSDDELFEKARYIDLNPVRRGLVKHAEEWPWSSARSHQGDMSSPVRTDPIPR